MIPSLIKLFDLVAVTPGTTLLDPVETNGLAMQCGYFVHPDACTPDAVTFLKSQQANLNSTFYKDWHDVARRSEFEMRIMQMLHYMSTYGTDYTGKPFTANPSPAPMEFAQLTVLMPCTPRQLFDRIAAMLSAPAALSDDTLDTLCRQLDEYYKEFGWQLDIDSVANRDAQARLCDVYGTLPEHPRQLLAYFLYKSTRRSMLIKDPATIRALEQNGHLVAREFSRLDSARLKALASVFYRYKPLMLAFRRSFISGDCTEAVAIINRLRRMARKYHRPATPGILDSIISPRHDMDNVSRAVSGEKSTFRLVRIAAYLTTLGSPLRAYIIRNGKLFVSDDNRQAIDSDRVNQLRSIVTDEIVRRLAAKSRHADGSPLTVRFPADVALAAPVSERQFVGDVPFGSSYALRTHNLVGIYWRNEWGTRDFDLWLTASDGTRLGWNADHRDGALLFSGDMTDADPEAAEIFYGPGDAWPDSIISVARYNGVPGSRFRLFFASDDVPGLPQGKMVRADSVLFRDDIVSDRSTTAVGVVHSGHICFGALATGSSRVPSACRELPLIGAIATRLGSYVPLRPLLLAAGFVEHTPGSPLPPDIDLQNLHRDTLLNLFS